MMDSSEECLSDECDEGRKEIYYIQHRPKKKKTVQELEKLRTGILKPAEFAHSLATRRSHTLRLSSCRTIELSHHSSVNTLDVDPAEHRYLLSGAKNGRLLIHDLQNDYGKGPFISKVISKIDRENPCAHKYSVERVEWYPHDSGMFTSSGMDKHLKIWDTNVLITALDIKANEKIYNHAMSKLPGSNGLIAVASAEKRVTILDLKTGSSSHELIGHNSGVLNCCWSPREENLLATAGRDSRILLWDIRSAKSCLKSLDQHDGKGTSNSEAYVTAHDGIVNGIQFSRDGFSLVSFGGDNRIRVWDVMEGKNKRVNFGTVSNSSQKSTQIALNNLDAEADLVYVPSRSKILGFNVSTGVRVSVLTGHYYTVNCCIYDQWYQILYSGGKDHYILLWSSEDYFEDSDDRPSSAFTINSTWSESD